METRIDKTMYEPPVPATAGDVAGKTQDQEIPLTAGGGVYVRGEN